MTYWDWSLIPIKDGAGKVTNLVFTLVEVTDRVLAEQRLLREKALNEDIVRNMPAGIAFLDNDFVLKKCNPPYGEMIKKYTPYSPEQALGMSYFDYVPGSREQVESWFCKVRDSGEAETRYAFMLSIKRDGKEEITYWDTSAAPIITPGGVKEGILILTQDVTPRNIAEEALRKSEERYRTLVNTSPFGIQLTDLKGKIVFSNPAHHKIQGYADGELVGRYVWDLMDEETQKSKAREYYKRLAQEQPPPEVYYSRDRTKDGRLIDVQIDWDYVRNSKGQVEAIISIVSDITERKRVEDALRESELRYRIVADNTYDWEFWVSPDENILYTSPSCERISGLDAKKFMDHPELLLEIIHPEDRERYVTKHGDLLKEEMALEFRIIRPDGEERWVEHACHPIFDYAGKLLGRRGSNRDCTERKRAEDEKAKLQAQLLQAQKMQALGTLSGGIAHDFNNSLGVILGYTEMAMLEAPDGKKLRDYLESVYKAGQRARDLVKQILLFSRQMKSELRPVKMGFIVEETIKLLRPALPSTIEIRQETLTAEDTILADLTQMHQVMLNLCTNAAHAMKRKGGILKIAIRSKRIDSESAPLFRLW